MTTTEPIAPAVSRRLSKLSAVLGEQGLDGRRGTDPFSRRYLSGFSGSSGYLVIGRAEAQIATDFRYWDQAGAQCAGFELYKTVGPLKDWFGGLVRPWGGRRLGFESGSLSYKDYREMRDLIADLPAGDRAELVPAAGMVEGLRAIKEPEEVTALERAIALGDAAFEAVAARVAAAGFEVPAVQSFGEARALFLKDPDGLRLEVGHEPG